MSNTPQRSFVGGELAPGLWGRTDLAKYASGLRTCRNFIIKKEGGAFNRAGTTFVTQTQSGSLGRLLPFVFNSDQTYVLEFTDRQLRFIRNGVVLGAPYALVTPYLSADLADLQISQSADVVVIVHPNYAQRELARIADTNWTLTVIDNTPSIDPPVTVTLVPAGSGGHFANWIVTAVDANGVESFPSDRLGITGAEIPIARTVQWSPVSGAVEYKVYKGFSVTADPPLSYGFIGSVGPGAVAFYDNNLTPDLAYRAPFPRDPFIGAGNYPAATSYFQGRRWFSGSDNAPETLYGSRSGDYTNFTVSTPVQDDDALTFTLASRQVNAVRHMVDSGTGMLVLTTGGEWIVLGDSSGILRPTDVKATQPMEWGVARQVPIKINQRVLFVQKEGAMVRDITSQPYVGYVGTDLTVFSGHLFEGYTIVDWCFAKTPDSIVWVVRSDGVLLGLTIVDEQQVQAWHRHDTDGVVERVCTVPENGYDAVYLLIARTIAGSTRRYVERLVPRVFTDVQDAVFMDSALTYDGRNTDAGIHLYFSGGSTWAYDELIALFSDSAVFVPGDIGNQFFVTGPDGTSVIRFRVTQYVSSTQVGGFPDKTIPVSMRPPGVLMAVWSRAVDTFSGLDHLEGKAVSVFADGFVVSSPYNPSIISVTVTGGSVTLAEPYAYVHIGLPYVSDLETLDIDSAEGPSLKEKRVNINALLAMVYKSRGIFAGADPVDATSLSGLVEFKVRNHEAWGEPVRLRTDTIEMKLLQQWSRHGHIFMRQVDPLPLAVLAVSPAGYIPGPS